MSHRICYVCRPRPIGLHYNTELSICTTDDARTVGMPISFICTCVKFVIRRSSQIYNTQRAWQPSLLGMLGRKSSWCLTVVEAVRRANRKLADTRLKIYLQAKRKTVCDLCINCNAKPKGIEQIYRKQLTVFSMHFRIFFYFFTLAQRCRCADCPKHISSIRCRARGTAGLRGHPHFFAVIMFQIREVKEMWRKINVTKRRSKVKQDMTVSFARARAKLGGSIRYSDVTVKDIII